MNWETRKLGTSLRLKYVNKRCTWLSQRFEAVQQTNASKAAQNILNLKFEMRELLLVSIMIYGISCASNSKSPKMLRRLASWAGN